MKNKNNQTWKGLEGKATSYADVGLSLYLRKAFLASAGYDSIDLDRPLIAILDTTSDYTTCHRDMPSLVQAVKRGVLEAGGLPFVSPTLSLGEILISPTSMLYRNLLAMETEEVLSCYPMDAAVLLGGCDKTLPAQLMAAASANLPSISVVTGPMRTGSWRGQRLGACTDCRNYWNKYRGGEINQEELGEIQNALCPSGGTCMVMGTASTMACLAETLGLMLPGSATAPSGSGDRLRIAVTSGRQAVKLAREPIRPRDILTRSAFNNAITVLMALGGSTNAIIHLLALARRAQVNLTLEDFDAFSSVPLLVNCKPTGAYWLEDLHEAGGVPVLLKALESLLDLDTRGLTGKTMKELLENQSPPENWQNIIQTLRSPFVSTGSLIILKGSLAPQGAVIKAAAATPKLLNHRGPAVVFESPKDAAQRIDDPSLKITSNHVLVLRNAGPVGCGMPEAGSLPIPSYLAQKGVKDIVRVSDARMSGTAFGTVVLHCSPESATGGPLALVKNGDLIELNVSEQRIDLLVEKTEMERRKGLLIKHQLPKRGWRRLHAQHVLPAHLGADLDFLVPTR